MIEIRSFDDGYYVIVNNEALVIDEPRIAGGEWMNPGEVTEQMKESTLISSVTFHKLGDRISGEEALDSLTQGTVISNGRFMFVKIKDEWVDLDTTKKYLPMGEFMVVRNPGIVTI